MQPSVNMQKGVFSVLDGDAASLKDFGSFMAGLEGYKVFKVLECSPVVSSYLIILHRSTLISILFSIISENVHIHAQEVQELPWWSLVYIACQMRRCDQR